MDYWLPRDALPRLTNELQKRTAVALKTLFEAKHLYQKQAVDSPKEIIAGIIEKFSPHGQDQRYFQHQLSVAGIDPVSFSSPTNGTPARIEAHSPYGGNFSCDALTFQPGNVKIYCAECDSREAAVLISLIAPQPIELQSFLATFRCQHCEKGSVSFLVKHENWTFSIQGRSPIEHVEVPAFIPKRESDYFRDALIAFNSGKTLAAIFYLRTFIEQFARRQTQLTGRNSGEEIMTAYSATLPKEHRESMPSLGKAYADLSESLHNPSSDSDIFETVKNDIEHHFDIRRVFKIPDAPKAGKSAEKVDQAVTIPVPDGP